MKNYNKNIYKYIMGLFLILACVSCEEEIGPAGPTTSHRIFYTNQEQNANTITVGSRIDFADVSQGVIERLWTFPDSILLEGELSDAQVAVYFLQAGNFDVNLHQVFEDSAYVEREEEKLGSELDTLIAVTVLPRVEITSIKANVLNKDGSIGLAIPLQSESKLEIVAGTTLRYTYESIGDPTVISGNFDGATYLEDEAAVGYFDVKYGSLGTYDMTAAFTRPQPRSADTIRFTNFVQTIGSTQPVDVFKISDRDGGIAVEFSRDIDPSTVEASDFSVVIETVGAGTITPSILEAASNPDNPAEIILTLDNETVYSDDQVNVSFVGGNLISADQKEVDSFTEVDLVHEVVNFLESNDFDHSFEKSDSEVTWVHNFHPPYSWWNGSLSTDFTATKSSTQVHDGSFSLKVDVDPGVGNVAIFPQNSGGSQHLMDHEGIGETAKLTAWVYVETALTTPGNTHLKLRMPELEMGWGNHGPAEFFNVIPVGEWVMVEDIVSTTNKTDAGATIAVNPVNFAGNNLVFYIDELVLQTWNPRP
ncbi:hypothetical protein [Reichenbachiella sp.]|uniref:hypothetical protein n=1 Tax=Reichenbachiella sp. TaxID=2184521 RepID=UPI003BAE19E6